MASPAPAVDSAAVREKAADEEKAPSKFQRYRNRHEWLDHLVRAGGRYTERHGDHYAAAITYFSVLALFPLILVAVAALGYVLFLQPDLLVQLTTGIAKNVPAGLDKIIVPIVDNAIASRNTFT